MIALLVAIVAALAHAWQARHYAQRVERAKAWARRANTRATRAEQRAEAETARAEAAEQRLRTARETMLAIAEAEAARVASARPVIAYMTPVRALPRPRITVAAPPCVDCARREVLREIVREELAAAFGALRRHA